MTRCPVCNRDAVHPPRLLCAPCGRSYDNAVAKDATTYALIVWAARRAHKCSRLEMAEIAERVRRETISEVACRFESYPSITKAIRALLESEGEK